MKVTLTENLDSTTEPTPDYMRESFTTDDGLVVPPPTREMGPRRLTRYRLDVADFLRALRDGTELPEEPVEYMGALPQGEAGSDTRKIYDRFNALLDEGAFDETNASGEVTVTAEEFPETTINESEVILSSDDLIDAQTSSSPIVEDSAEHASEEVIASEELAEVIEADDSESSEAVAEDSESESEEPHRFSHLFADEAEKTPVEDTANVSDAEVSRATEAPLDLAVEIPSSQVNDIVADEQAVVAEEATVTDEASEPEQAPVAEPVAESAVEAEPVEAVEANLAPADAVPTSQVKETEESEKPKSTPNRFDLIRAKAAKARSVSTVTGLPEPVSALDSQGIDFKALDQAEERAAEHQVSDADAPVEEVAPIQEPVAQPLEEELTVTEPVIEEPAEAEVATQESLVDEPEIEAVEAEDSLEREDTVSSDDSSFSVSQAVAQKSRGDQTSSVAPEVYAEAESAATPIDMPEKKSSTATWLMILSVVVIIVLAVIWMLFFK